MIDAQVIVIGAGPTGLMAACQLARFGIKVVIIDKKSGINTQSRALLLTARSLEVYQQMGLSRQVIKAGSAVRHISIYFNHKEKISIQSNLYQDDLSPASIFLSNPGMKNCYWPALKRWGPRYVEYRDARPRTGYNDRNRMGKTAHPRY